MKLPKLANFWTGSKHFKCLHFFLRYHRIRKEVKHLKLTNRKICQSSFPKVQSHLKKLQKISRNLYCSDTTANHLFPDCFRFIFILCSKNIFVSILPAIAARIYLGCSVFIRIVGTLRKLKKFRRASRKEGN